MTEELDETLDRAENKAEEFSQTMQELKQVKQELRELLEQHKDQINPGRVDTIQKAIKDGDYGRARQEFREAFKEKHLQFEDEDLDLFADLFRSSFDDLEEGVERIRNQLVELNRKGAGRSELKDIIYANNSGLTKSTINRVFDAIDTAANTGLSDKTLARVIAAFDTNLKISDTEKIVSEVRKRGEV